MGTADNTNHKFRVGVLSDTHGVLRPEVLPTLEGADEIIHAGDIVDPEILTQLGQIAPVHAVRGNVDGGSWAARLPKTEVVGIGKALIYVLHDVGRLDLDPAAAGFSAVVFGHSHRPELRRENGVLYLNPGSCGPRRFNLPATLGELYVQETGELYGRIIDLQTGRDLAPREYL